MTTILVQMADKRWTLQALHLACALARNDESQVVLVRLMQVSHPSYLGTEFGMTTPTPGEYSALREYGAIAEDYGVELTVRPMQCLSIWDAVADAADCLDAGVVFAHVPPSRIPYRRKLQVWGLERRLAAAHRRLYTLEQPTNTTDWTPSITVRGARRTAGGD